MTTKMAIYGGRVQGVGFRYTVKQIASGFDVQGTVENLPDGTVRVRAMAWDEEEVDAFLQEIEEGQLASFIREQQIEDIPELDGVRGFSIIR